VEAPALWNDPDRIEIPAQTIDEERLGESSPFRAYKMVTEEIDAREKAKREINKEALGK